MSKIKGHNGTQFEMYIHCFPCKYVRKKLQNNKFSQIILIDDPYGELPVDHLPNSSPKILTSRSPRSREPIDHLHNRSPTPVDHLTKRCTIDHLLKKFKCLSKELQYNKRNANGNGLFGTVKEKQSLIRKCD
jgi:hypothetical protein